MTQAKQQILTLGVPTAGLAVGIAAKSLVRHHAPDWSMIGLMISAILVGWSAQLVWSLRRSSRHHPPK